MEIRSCRSNNVVAKQAEYDAEEPNPAPMGRLDRAVNVNDGLQYDRQDSVKSIVSN